ncbi:APOC1 protein, partial [Atractosteus spatula]|nr:APOC1 protein [Atractosteus spatula]
MKLPVAIAVLVLVLAVHSDAAEEPTIEERFANFHTQVKEFTSDLTEKAKTTFEQIHQSEFAVKTRNWFSEQFDKAKQKFEETFKQK